MLSAASFNTQNMAADSSFNDEEESSSRQLGRAERSIVKLYDVWTAISESEVAGECLTQSTVDSIFNCLTPRHYESKNGPNEDKNEDQSTALELALQCFVKIVHLVHQASPQQHCEIDVPTLLIRFLKILDLSDAEAVNYDEMSLQIISLLGAIPRVLNYDDRAVLKAIFLGIDCFQSFVRVLDTMPSDSVLQNRIVIAVIHAIWAVMDSSPPAKEVFKDTVGYSHFCEYLKHLKEPSCACIKALLDWAVEGRGADRNTFINNVEIILMLFDWLPDLPVEHQRYIAESLGILCNSSTHNAMVCSLAGVFARVVRIFEEEPEIDDQLGVLLIGVLEAMGSHSVTSSEFKQMIGLFRPHENGSQTKLTHPLLEALVKMAAFGGQTRAKHYFDLHHPSSGITVPVIQKWCGGGFTFHAWICLETVHHGNEVIADQQRPQHRRQLYSFFAASGNGLEAFLTPDNKLVVAVCYKKEYITASLPQTLFSDNKWHSVTVVHSPRRTFGNSTVVVYIDGDVKLSCPMRFPSLSEEFISCHIGSGGPQTVARAQQQSHFTGRQSFRFSFPFMKSVAVDTASTPGANACVIPAGRQDDVWGVPSSLEGQLGPVCVFNEALQENTIQQLHQSGPNNLNLFQPPDVTGAAKSVLAGLAGKLILYYNSKAGCDHVCCDLTPPHAGHTPLDGRLTGHRCFTWDLKDVFNSIGGVNVFLPLLEQIYKQEKQRTPLFSVGSQKSMVDRQNGFVAEEKSEINTFSDVFGHNRNTSVNSMTDIPVVNRSSKTSMGSSTEDPYEEQRLMSGRLGPVFVGQSEEWIVVDKSKDNCLGRKEIREICDSSTCSDIALYIYLLVSLLKEDEIHEHNHSVIIGYVGNMLQRSHVSLIDCHVLSSVQALVDCVTPGREQLLNSIYRDIVFNFAIWGFSELEIRIGHLQYVSTLIKDNPSRFRENFGIKFFLDVIRLYYSEGGEILSNNNGTHSSGAVELTKNEIKAIRGSLIVLVKYYFTHKVKQEEVGLLVEYLASTTDSEQVIEALNVLLSLCDTSSSNKMVKRLSDPDYVYVLVALLCKHNAKKLHLKVLKIISNILMSNQVYEATKDCWRLKEVGFSALTEFLSQDVSEDLVKALMMLGVSAPAEDKGVEIYGHYDVVLAVVRMIRNEDLNFKLYIAHLILRSMDASNASVAQCAAIPGWYEAFFHLISSRQEPRKHEDSSALHNQNEHQREEQDLVDTVLEIVFRVLWKGVNGYDETSWKQRGEAIAAVSTIASTEKFLRPSRIIERSLLELCIFGALEDINQSGETGVSQTSNAVQVMKLVGDFLFTPGQRILIVAVKLIDLSTLPACIAGCGEEEDKFTWSIRLVDGIDQLLEALNVWDDDTDGSTEWVEMAQTGIKILMTFISCKEPEFCATASSKLSKLLKSRSLHSQGEICYIIGKLYKAYITSIQTHDCRNFTFIIPVIRLVLLRYYEFLPLAMYIPTFTVLDRNHPQFEEEFIQLLTCDEFKAFVKQQINPSMKQYEVTFLQSLMVSGRFWMECLTELTSSLSKWEQMCRDSKEFFEEKILVQFRKLQDKQKEYSKMLVKQRRHREAVVQAHWDELKYDLTSERAPWGSRSPREVHWKLSTTETFQRMRLKLTQNHSFDPHLEASHARDRVEGGRGSVSEEDKESTLPLKVAKEAVVHDAIDDKLDGENEESINTYSPPNSPSSERRQTMTEKLVLDVACELITLMDKVPGRLEITNVQVYFYSSRNGTSESMVDTTDRDFQWALIELREVHLRRYNLRRSALEFFLVDQTNYFINFDKETRNLVYKKIMSLKPPNLYYTGSRSPAQLLKASGLTQKWVRREISNFEYLMQLNTIAGRTYNDLSQYPVFPWILSDYTSPQLDLSDSSVYRDLSKPVGVLNPVRVAEVQDRYKYFEDLTGTIAKFHYGTHYSNAAGVLHYMIRVEPFTTLHVNLQSGKFDCPNRQFHDVGGMWNSIYYKGSDVKELIPEFFYFPEMFMNLNKFDLGRLHNGEMISDVILPPWASSAEEFVYKHRQALESEYVSTHLHDWIDLIFGYKQKGATAVDALNVFYYCTYEGAVDLDAITDPHEREATEGMINNFGQTPSQLLTEPHPLRMSREEAAGTKVVNVGVTSKSLASLFSNFDRWKAYCVTVTNGKDPLIFTAVPKIQVRSLIHTGMPDQLITVSKRGILGTQDWLPYSKSQRQPFTFELDPSLAVDKLRRYLAGPFAPDLAKSPKLFAITHDAKLIITVGHWDNSIRVFSSKGKLLTRIVAHTDVVTCLSLDNDGRHLMCGSCDTTSTIWIVAHQAGLAQEMKRTPLQTLYGHDDKVTCVAISWELDIAISGSKDGTCIIHTTRNGQYVRSLRPETTHPSSTPSSLYIKTLALSDCGDIVMFCRGGQPAKLKTKMLCVYSINGKQLKCDDNNACEVEDIVISGEYVIIGDRSKEGRLVVRSLHSFNIVKQMNLKVPIRCVSLAKDNTHVFVCLDDGKLVIVALTDS